jgi:membrane fusion protein (multidrug efflux system)
MARHWGRQAMTSASGTGFGRTLRGSRRVQAWIIVPPLIAACAAISGCSVKAKPVSPTKLPEVGVATVVRGTDPAHLELAGRTSAFEVSEVRPQVSGIVRRRLFEEGAYVRAGQPLYQIDDGLYRAAEAQAAAALHSAEASRKTVCLRADRIRHLLDLKFVSPQQAEDANAGCDQAAASVEQTQAVLDAARLNLAYTRLSAPIAGRIGRSVVTQGALVTANQGPSLATIQRLDPIYVDISRSAADLMRFRKILTGAPGSAAASVRLKLPDGADYPEAGTLQFSEASVDQQTGAVMLRAVFPNPRGELLPGMYVRAQLAAAMPTEVLLAPQAAVRFNAKGEALVWVVTPGNKVEERPVATGKAAQGSWVVTRGLQAGDRLVVEGAMRVKAGITVRPVNVAAQAAALAPEPAKRDPG